nr:MAG TPA: hypothetical protein [Caudoviricetes sp.]
MLVSRKYLVQDRNMFLGYTPCKTIREVTHDCRRRNRRED